MNSARKPGILFGYWNTWVSGDSHFTFFGFDFVYHDEIVEVNMGFLGIGIILGLDFHNDDDKVYEN